jgi:hypothetical protein
VKLARLRRPKITCFSSYADTDCGELTGVLNKLRVWVWHSPKPQKGANTVMPSKIARLIGTASAAEVGRCSTAVFFFNVYIWREAVTGSSCSQRSHCLPHPPEMPVCLMLLLCIINALEAAGLVCLNQSTQPTWPQLYACFVHCLLSFLHLPLPPQLGF